MSPSALKHQSIHNQTVASSFFLQEEILAIVKYIFLHNKTQRNEFLKSNPYSNSVPHKIIMSHLVKKAFRGTYPTSVAC